MGRACLDTTQEFRGLTRFRRFAKVECAAEVAQLVEQPIRNRQVPGSSPGLGSILSFGTLDTAVPDFRLHADGSQVPTLTIRQRCNRTQP
jgi:hypothetical protein